MSLLSGAGALTGRCSQTVARRSGQTSTAVKDTHLPHHKLMLSIDQIATLTGTERATVCAHRAAAQREQIPESEG